MKRTTLALQMAPMAAIGARPCATAYEQRWAVGGVDVEPVSQHKTNAFGTIGAPALGRPPS